VAAKRHSDWQKHVQRVAKFTPLDNLGNTAPLARQQADLNLGKNVLDGKLTSNIAIDTSQAAAT
jgi:hypothetical protein